MTQNIRAVVSELPLCNLNAIHTQWDQTPIRKGWKEKVHEWMYFVSAPSYGKKQNYCELTGTILLIPGALCFGVFLIKQPKNAHLCYLTLQKIAAAFVFTIILPLTIVGAIIKGVGEMLSHPKIECDDTSKTKTHPLIIHASYFMTEKFVKACEQIQFNQYFAVAGTLLGAVRHKGMIPWDDDVDLAVNEADIPLLNEKLRPLLEAEGIVWETQTSLKMIRLSFNQTTWNNLVEEYRSTHLSEQIPQSLIEQPPNIIDLGMYAMMSDGSWTYASSASRTMFPTDYVTLLNETEISKPQQYIQFGSLKLPTFSNQTIIRYLKMYYGSDCLKYGIQTHTHGSINTCCGRMIVLRFYPNYRFKITNSAVNTV